MPAAAKPGPSAAVYLVSDAVAAARGRLADPAVSSRDDDTADHQARNQRFPGLSEAITKKISHHCRYLGSLAAVGESAFHVIEGLRIRVEGVTAVPADIDLVSRPESERPSPPSLSALNGSRIKLIS